MSYCRFSSDDFQSDVYAYADVNGGYTVWLAARRLVGKLTPLPELTKGNIEEYMRAVEVQRGELETMDKGPVNLPYAGERINYVTLEDFLDGMLYLRKLGYHVPNEAIDRIREEMRSDTRDA